MFESCRAHFFVVTSRWRRRGTEAVAAFHALCEGLAAMELRSLLPDGHEARFWRDALSSLVRGFAAA